VKMLLEQPAQASVMEGSRTRRCIVSGEVLPEGRLVRFAVAPDGHVIPDVDAKLPGRGLWVRAERKSVEQAVSKGLFARAAGEPVKADSGLPRARRRAWSSACWTILALAAGRARSSSGLTRWSVLLEAPPRLP